MCIIYGPNITNVKSRLKNYKPIYGTKGKLKITINVITLEGKTINYQTFANSFTLLQQRGKYCTCARASAWIMIHCLLQTVNRLRNRTPTYYNLVRTVSTAFSYRFCTKIWVECISFVGCRSLFLFLHVIHSATTYLNPNNVINCNREGYTLSLIHI